MRSERLQHIVTAAALAALVSPAIAGAQVEKVELDIAGYLCGF